MKSDLRASSCLSTGAWAQRAHDTRKTYRCDITNEEIDSLGPKPTWDDWKPLLLSKGIPPMRLVEGAEFRMTETSTGATLEFP